MFSAYLEINATKTWLNYHGHVDVGGLELHVDLLVDESLAVIVVVHADDGHLDEVVVDEFVMEKKKQRLFSLCRDDCFG